MLNDNCPVSVECPGSDFPVGNFSSEASDGPDFIGVAFPGSSGGVSGSGFPGYPGPLGPMWWIQGCLGLCVSYISAEDAYNCALAQSIICGQTLSWQQWTEWWWTTYYLNNGFPPSIPPVVPPNQEIFGNAEQTCSVTCASGQQFSATIPAGTVVGYSQTMVDSVAYSMACNTAKQNRICINPSGQNDFHMDSGGNGWNCATTSPLADVPLITVSGPGGPFTIELVGGQIPIGTSFFQSSDNEAQLVGTLSTPGTYVFTVRVTSS